MGLRKLTSNMTRNQKISSYVSKSAPRGRSVFFGFRCQHVALIVPKTKVPFLHTHNLSLFQHKPRNLSPMAAVGSNDVSDFSGNFLIVRPESGGAWDLLKYMVFADIGCGLKILEGSDEVLEGGFGGGGGRDQRWVILVSIIVLKIIALFRKPMEWTGFLVDFVLNLLFLNGNLIGLIFNILHGRVVIPQRGSETFLSTIGHLDGRIDLYHSKYIDDSVFGDSGLRVELGDRALIDLCMMSSKLAYENDKVVRNVVIQHWKMHFVDFLNCWNDYQKEMATQVFIFCDKPQDASFIIVSFRGTELFDADDWITDFDYSWYEIPNVGKIHLGFLEALGLGNRADIATFENHLDAKKNVMFASTESGRIIPPDMVERTAYYAVRRKLKNLLNENRNARFVVTGHSLGGALAILFPTVLVLHEETELMQRFLGVYTFGQPRIGNEELGKFVEARMQHPVQKYFRVVYCNDLVPRLPYDDKNFLYKHFGTCFYYDSFYMERVVDEEPNPNYFGARYFIGQYMTAVWELIRSFAMSYIYGPEYREGWFSLLRRLLGLALPGISDHCPTDYINSVRLGKTRKLRMSSI